MNKKLSGVYTALVTPFDKKGRVDEDGLRELIHFQLAAGVEGILVLGTTGEAPTLTHSEKQFVLRIAREETIGKLHLMVGTGTNFTAQTIEYTKEAKALGADSVLVVTPYYNRPTQEGIYQHYQAITSAVDIPLVVYNIPGRTCQNIQTDTLLRISSLPHVIGVKDSSGNISQIMDVIEKLTLKNPSFSVLSGDDSLALPCIAMGGSGVVSVLGNLIPMHIKAMIHEALEENWPCARNLHYRLAPLFRAAFLETNPIPIKAMMERSGFPSGRCRLPLCELLPENESKIATILEEASVACTVRENQLLHNQKSVYISSVKD